MEQQPQKALLTQLYEDNKPLLEVGGFVSITAALMLSLPAKSGFIGETLGQIQFFLLTAACLFAGYLAFLLMFTTVGHVIGNENPERENIINFTRQISLLLFIFLIALFFAFNLVAYLIFSYTTDSIVLGTILIIYLLMALPIKKYRGEPNPSPSKSIFYVTSMLFLLVAVPIVIYIVFFFSLTTNPSSVLLTAVCSLILAVILGTLFVFGERRHKDQFRNAKK